MFPLTPAEAIAVALVIDVRVAKMRDDSEAGAYWASIADRLRAWGQQQLQTEHEEGEMPSQDRVSGSADGTLGVENEAAPKVRKHPEDLTALPQLS